MPVSVGGLPVDIDAIKEFAEQNNLSIIEDSAAAFGAEYKNQKVGSFGYTTTFSFHMGKHLLTVEGGCVTTNNAELAEKLKLIRNHGMEKLKGHYRFNCFGLNLRITDIQSAIGRVQLGKIDKIIAKRNDLAKIYQQQLRGLVEFQEVPAYATKHTWMFFSCLFDPLKRDDINQYLNENGIATRVCWLPTHLQPYHSGLFPNEHYPRAEEIASRTICPPLGNGHSTEDIRQVCAIIKQAAAQK